MQKNRIELAGYLGAKPSVRYLPSGTPVANVRMAEGYRYTDRVLSVRLRRESPGYFSGK